MIALVGTHRWRGGVASWPGATVIVSGHGISCTDGVHTVTGATRSVGSQRCRAYGETGSARTKGAPVYTRAPSQLVALTR